MSWDLGLSVLKVGPSQANQDELVHPVVSIPLRDAKGVLTPWCSLPPPLWVCPCSSAPPRAMGRTKMSMQGGDRAPFLAWVLSSPPRRFLKGSGRKFFIVVEIKARITATILYSTVSLSGIELTSHPPGQDTAPCH